MSVVMDGAQHPVSGVAARLVALIVQLEGTINDFPRQSVLTLEFAGEDDFRIRLQQADGRSTESESSHEAEPPTSTAPLGGTDETSNSTAERLASGAERRRAFKR
jgi:hypothetical protein